MVIASLDLKDSKAVQLRQGRELMLEEDNVVELAEYFNKFGEVAVIDLDAAAEQGSNQALIEKILSVAQCRVGGGIRSVEQAECIIKKGAHKIIVGSAVFLDHKINHQFLEALCNKLKRQQIIIALDSWDEEVVINGWTRKTGHNLHNLIPVLEQYCSEFLCTFVEQEGTMQGIDLERVKSIKSLTNNKLTIAGGIKSLEEIRLCSQLGIDVQLGMALYTKEIDLGEAFIESLNWRTQLLPTITQDFSGQVLMCAYVSKESLKRTFESGVMWYFSRARNKLWMKGESSRHIQHLIQLRTDCDRDTILATVDQCGVACHLGNYSCFGAQRFNIDRLYRIVASRLATQPANSYTAQLSDQEVKNKIIEEANELIGCQDIESVVWETADLVYFLMVNLAKKGIPLVQVYNELRRRHR